MRARSSKSTSSRIEFKGLVGPPVKSTTWRGETLILSAILRLTWLGGSVCRIGSQQPVLEGDLGPSGWADRLTRDDLPNHGLQGLAAKSSVTDSTDVSTIAASRHPKLKNRDLVGPGTERC
jgi:hypothetical protein